MSVVWRSYTPRGREPGLYSLLPSLVSFYFFSKMSQLNPSGVDTGTAWSKSFVSPLPFLSLAAALLTF